MLYCCPIDVAGYYGDISTAELNDSDITDDTIKKGFDFYHCFGALYNSLASRLGKNEWYPLLEFDLFTLCDLIISRLQVKQIKSRGSIWDTFFYHSGNNSQSSAGAQYVVDSTLVLLNSYLEQYTAISGKDDLTDEVYIYFYSMRNLLTKCSNRFKDDIGKESAEKSLYICAQNYLSEISKFASDIQLDQAQQLITGILFTSSHLEVKSADTSFT